MTASLNYATRARSAKSGAGPGVPELGSWAAGSPKRLPHERNRLFIEFYAVRGKSNLGTTQKRVFDNRRTSCLGPMTCCLVHRSGASRIAAWHRTCSTVATDGSR
jgi:hypothetical protein